MHHEISTGILKYCKLVKSCSSSFCLCWSQMGSLSKKVPHPRDNFLLSACQFTASSQVISKFMEFVHLHGADSISQKSPKFYLLTHYFTYICQSFSRQFVFLPIHQSFPLHVALKFTKNSCETHSQKDHNSQISTLSYYVNH